MTRFLGVWLCNESHNGSFWFCCDLFYKSQLTDCKWFKSLLLGLALLMLMMIGV